MYKENLFITVSLGTKHIDGDSGLIYFKYDFGYEFGIIFPGEGRKYIVGSNQFQKKPLSQQFLHNSAGAIDVPVTHEHTIKKNLMPYQSRKNVFGLKPAICGKITKQSPVEINVDEFHAEAQPLLPKGAVFSTQFVRYD